ncbi:hypothetical protein [Sphingobacterium suaedae]|uniref:DUF4397 domain-containing protein n=1 Tax=Sphingobacterium suaedae TaxID=1686402 RepID=A0ABW5KPE6_9SPHI
MKSKLILTLLVFVAICVGQRVHAQTDNTDPVNVSIDLTAPVISINLGGTPDVLFTYDDAADYTVAQTVSKPGHLVVVSNEPYSITVAASAAFAPAGGPGLDVVTINAEPATANGATLTEATLATGDALLVTDAPPSNNAVYNVDYTIEDATTLLDVTRAVYTTTVVYTATQL